MQVTMSTRRASHSVLIPILFTTDISPFSSEQQNVRLWVMSHVMLPSLRLLNTKATPLSLRHQVLFRYKFCYFLGQ